MSAQVNTSRIAVCKETKPHACYLLFLLAFMNSKTALIIGATGLTGAECLRLLLQSDNYNKVIALVRKPLELSHPKLLALVLNFENLEQYAQQIKADDIYCAIGTTIGKAGSHQAFKKVDYEIPLKVAQLALQNGAKKFILVSSMGANAKSGIFYSRVKGELEEAIKKLNYLSFIIFRPSLLLGNRKEKRTGEAIGRWVSEKLSFLFSGPLKKYKGTPVDILAKAMLKAALQNINGVRIIENEEIFVLAE